MKLQYSTDEDTRLLLNRVILELSGKKYGLVWEEHEEKVDIQLKTGIPVFIEDKSKEIIGIEDNTKFNFLLEGDNLHSLKLLEKTHTDSIDLIYIDPPYNTGNKDFIYNDDYIDENDGFRHSKWISFMSERLEIARKLLTEEGCIFIQISDIEVAQLKLLCDEIFGEENFLNIINVNMKNIAGASGGGEDKRFKKNCEYILIYAKNYSMLPIFNGTYKLTRMSTLVNQYKEEGKSWKYISVLTNKGEKEYIESTVDGDGNEIKIFKRNGLETMPISQYAKKLGITVDDVYDYHWDKIFRTTMPQSSIRPRVMEKMKDIGRYENVISIEYIPKTGRNKGVVYEQFYSGEKYNLFAWLSDVTDVRDGIAYKKDLQGTYWDFVGSTKNLSKEGNVEFPNGKKSIDLLKQIISLYPKKDITVLDFFAGSGSTGHAVIAKNQEDGGTRRFILCTNNEVSEESRDKFLIDIGVVKNKKEVNAFIKTDNFKKITKTEDYLANGIARSITYVRLKNVIYGYKNDKGKEYKGLPANLKYYKTDFVEKYSDDPNYFIEDKLMEHIVEMIQLENGFSIDNDKYIVLLTDEAAEEFETNIDSYHPIKIYVDGTVFLSQKIMNKLDYEGVEVLPIPDYYFAKDIRGDN